MAQVRNARPAPVTSRAVDAPRPALRVGDAVAIIVGTVVGAGIFRMPPLVAGNAGSENAVMLAWLAGGIVSLIGALCYAELASTFPHAGGEYHFLERALGRRVAFLFGWARMSVIQTGSIALLAYTFGDYVSQALPFAGSAALYAALVIVVLTALNIIGVREGKTTQNVLTTFEVLGVLAVVVAGFLLPAAPARAAAGASSSAFGLMMVFVLLTYGGWNEAAYISAEVRRPRDMVRALVLSLIAVTALYVLVNWAYLRSLGLAGVAGSTAVAADVVERAFGTGSGRLIAVLVAISVLTSANATIFTGARSVYAVGRDFGKLSFLGRWHAGTGTPVNGLLLQGAAALALVGLGVLTRKGFETMVEYTAPVFWLFFLLTGLSLFVLRSKEPSVERVFRVPLYPLTPLLFCLTCSYLLYSSLAYTGIGALVGVIVLAIGAVLLPFARGRDPQGGN
jgi:amino acid transporter